MYNLFDLNYQDTHMRTDSFSFSKFIASALRIFLFLFKSIFRDLLFPRFRLNKLILFYTTDNQKKALNPLFSYLSNGQFVSFTIRNDHVMVLPGVLLSFLCIPIFILRFIFHKRFKIGLLNFVDRFFYIDGLVLWFYVLIKLNKSKMVIVSNDHIVWTRIIITAAKLAKIKTVYLQHASVTSKFPKLDFDLSLLEGMDAFEKYDVDLNKLDKSVFLIGMPKLDQYKIKIQEKKENLNMGIALNLLDDKKSVMPLIQQLIEDDLVLLITIRLHPADNNFAFLRNLKNLSKIRISNKSESSFEFLEKIDICISGESSIHLESVLVNKEVIYYDFNSPLNDHYGYIKNDLIRYLANSPIEVSRLLRIIKINKDIRIRAKRYVHTVSGKYDGRSTELASNYINKFLKT